MTNSVHVVAWEEKSSQDKTKINDSSKPLYLPTKKWYKKFKNSCSNSCSNSLVRQEHHQHLVPVGARTESSLRIFWPRFKIMLYVNCILLLPFLSDVHWVKNKGNCPKVVLAFYSFVLHSRSFRNQSFSKLQSFTFRSWFIFSSSFHTHAYHLSIFIHFLRFTGQLYLLLPFNFSFLRSLMNTFLIFFSFLWSFSVHFLALVFTHKNFFVKRNEATSENCLFAVKSH